MALLEDHRHIAWQNMRAHFNEAVQDGKNWLLVIDEHTNDDQRSDIATSVMGVKKDELSEQLSNVAQTSDKTVVCVFDLSLPYEQAQKDLSELPDEVTAQYNLLIAQRAVEEKGWFSRIRAAIS